MPYRLSLFLALLVAACSPPAGSTVQPVGTDVATEDAESRGSFRIEIDAALERYPDLAAHLRTEAEMARNAFLAMAASDYRAWQDDGEPWDWRPYEAETAWSLDFENACIVSAFGSYYEYTGGAHPNSGFASVLWDIRGRHVLTLEDLLTDASDGSAAMTALFDAAIAGLVDQKRARMGEAYDAQADAFWLDELEPRADLFSDLTLAPSTEPGRAGGVIVHFEPYVAGAYAEGSYHIVIPQSVFAAYLDAEWADLFGGDPDVDPQRLQP